MLEAKAVRVQELPFEAEVTPHAVTLVAGDLEVDRGEVHADLVSPPRLQCDLEERVLGKELHELEAGHGVPRLVGVERAQRTLAAVPADRRIDASGSRLRTAADEREIPALHLAPSNRLLEAGVRVLGARDDEQAGRVTVETVDDPGTLGVGTASGAERQELRQERRAPHSRRGVHGEPGRLVQHEEMLVLVSQRNRDWPGRHVRGRSRQDDLDDGAGLEPVALCSLRAVHANRAVAQQPLGEGACADLGASGERPVQARAGVVLSDREAESRHAGDHASDGACRQGRARRTGRRLRRR